MLSQSYHMTSEDLKCSMRFVWTTFMILYEAWKPQSSKEGPVRFFKILFFVCVCSKEERKPHEWNNMRVSKDIISIFLKWTIRFKTFWLFYTSQSNVKRFFIILQNIIFNWILWVIVSFNGCIWFPWVCCFKNKGKCLMEWMVFCRLSIVCNANSA